jgi:uncharacterized protein YbjT (DUF2867 family)
MNGRQSRVVLVCGATGRQGGSVARALLGRGHTVRAFTRHPDSLPARTLASLGALVVEGDFEDRESLEAAASGVDTVYSMGTSRNGTELETRHGQAVAVAAKAARVGHLIYSSVASADRKTGIPHFESKFKVERYINNLGVPFTISAPVTFMDNILTGSSLPDLHRRRLRRALPGNRRLQQIALRDVGAFAAALVERREEVFGRRFDIAGDEVDGDRQAALLSRITGLQVEYQRVPLELLETQHPDLAAMYDWLDRVGYSADIPGLRREFPEVGWHTFEAWAREQNWSAIL